MMRILLLTNYFTPDLSAGTFRMQALVEALEPYAAAGLEVDLITTRPNRWSSVQTRAPEYDDRGWLRIHRVAVATHQGGMYDQARAYVRYALAVHRLTNKRAYDLVFATSSRLMTMVLGAHVARQKNALLYLDVRDLFILNMAEILAKSPARFSLPLFDLLERWSIGAAHRINVVSEGFIPYIRRIAPNTHVSCFTNGIDDLFLSTEFDIAGPKNNPPLIVYAGNMGEGQGLHRIVPFVANAMHGEVRFRLIGDGGKRRELEELLIRHNVSNVELLPPTSRADLLEHYKEADILFLHLNDLAAFRKVLPSKLFEYGATGKPILAGVSGSAADFAFKELPGTEVFPPCDTNSMIASIKKLLAAPPLENRSVFRAKYTRQAIMKMMALDLMTYLKSSIR